MGMRDFAAQARSAVVAEVRANLTELERTGPTLDSTKAELGRVVQEKDLSQLTGLAFELPEISSAAWTAAQVSQAAPYLDYEWVIQVARAYESYQTYQRIANAAVDGVASIIGGGPSLDRVSVIYGNLVVLSDLHRQVQERFQGLVESGR